MKIAQIAAAALLAALAVPAFAQSVAPSALPPAAQPHQMAAATKDGVTGTQPGQWIAPYGQPLHEKTRAEVYQELVQAEQDGQLQYLNSTLYAH